VGPKNPKQALLEKFRQVCTERVNTILENFSIIIENPSDKKNVDLLMREIHTLKGELRIMGFVDGGQIIHSIEDVLKELNNNSFADAADFNEIITEGLDTVSDIVVGGDKPDVDEVCQKISNWKNQIDQDSKRSPTKKTRKTKAKKAPVPKKEEIQIKSADEPKESTTSVEEKPADKPAQQISSIVRVSGAKLDELSAMVGEMFTSHLRLMELSTNFNNTLTDVRELQEAIKNSGNGEARDEKNPLLSTWKCQALGRNLAQLRRSFFDRASGMSASLEQVLSQVKELRLLPISSLFDLYKTAARDIARQRLKRISVRSEGGSTMIDRSVMDALGDILLHLIRNAVDHGIDPPAQREALGKPSAGTITFRARQIGDRVVVEVEDDGAGINLDNVKKIAINNGLTTRSAAQRLTEEEVLDFIFQPGFSTMEKTSEISGRGVGMDVVRTRVKEFGGALQVKTSKGKGTCFSLELPTSIAINRVLLFRSSEHIFGVLATFVGRVNRININSLIESSGGQAIVIDDKTIPITDAADILQLGKPAKDFKNPPIILLEHGGRTLALIVDELLGERELTIKPVGSLLFGTQTISGAATLEDGSIVLILGAGDLITLAGRSVSRPSITKHAAEKRSVPRALLVEDSLVTRELERGMLVSLGLIVEEASDGIEALEKLRAMDFDIVVTDIEMPRLDGFGLTERIKQDDRYSHIPVILVTTRSSEEDRQKGIDVGADAHVTKDDFQTKTFLETVRQFLP
jgi:chemotaxis protein histidine kinase CheA